MLRLGVVTILVLLPGGVFGAAAAEPQDPLGRTTPYGTAVGFLEAATKHDYRTAVRFLDSRLPADQNEQLARQLKLVIDRALTLDPNTVSRDPAGEPGEEGRAGSQVLLGVARAGADTLDIYVERVTRGTGPAIWLFSAGTLKGIPEFSEEVKPSWYELYVAPHLSASIQEKTFLWLPVKRWVQILILLLVGVSGTYLLMKSGVPAYERLHLLATKRQVSVRESGMMWPFRFLAVLIMLFVLSRLSVTFLARQLLVQFERGLWIVGCVWLGMKVTDAVCNTAVQRSQQAARTGRLAVIHLSRGVTKLLLVVAGVLVALAQAGVDLSTVVAGLGIGGIAVAFAAQKTIENLFGTVTFVTDQPARVGDFCRIGEVTGTIESVGLRSSRIRTVEDTLLTIPNGQLSTSTLDNISARGKILFRHTVGLSYSTTSEQLGNVLEGMENMFREHAKVEGRTFRVRLIRFGASSLDVELFAYVLTRDWREFLAIQQGLLVRVMQIVEGAGSSIAFPSQTLYFANTPR